MTRAFQQGEDDQSSETEEDLSSVYSKGRTTAANLNFTSEHHESSEDFGHKRKHVTTDVDSMKKNSSLPASVIRHTRDEPRHISSPPVNANTTPELINEAEDYAQANSPSNVYDDGHAVASPSHFIWYARDKCFFFKSQIDRHYVIHSGERSFCCQICEQKLVNVESTVPTTGSPNLCRQERR
ncbi:hypothetical protein AVEN_169216-1 [Araneus ventricosus]|uniref:C2H2-type domain-containing protein n=1 Tax=Araneus ventricosus TaxID=182803 RepID=A0A4Y2I6N2_ARAVE|nr:hypothetical protein AVEN_169216-1 [Araneus ventricosus]